MQENTKRLDQAPGIGGRNISKSGREPGLSSTLKPQFNGAIAKRALAIKYVQQRNIEGLIEQLNQQQRRLFACDCATYTLHHFERAYPSDDAPRHAIEAARGFVKEGIGVISLEGHHDAAMAVARVARQERKAAAHAAALSAAWTTVCYLRNDDQQYDIWSACISPRYSAWAQAVSADEVGSVLTSELPDILDKLWRNNDDTVATWSGARSWQLRKLAEYHRI